MRAVIFDMDGVLTATVEYHYLSWKKVVSEYRIPFTHQDNEKLLGLTRRRSLEVILGERHLPEEQIQEILRRKNMEYLGYVAQMSAADLLPGVAALLDELRSNRIRTAVASASHNTRLVLHKLGIENKIDFICDGNMVHRSKPAPDVYLQAASGIGTRPVDCLALEDSTAGIQAARTASMCVVGLGPSERVGEADDIFPSLRGVQLKDLRQVYDRWRSSWSAREIDTRSPLHTL